jgi:hypothetical protein
MSCSLITRENNEDQLTLDRIGKSKRDKQAALDLVGRRKTAKDRTDRSNLKKPKRTAFSFRVIRKQM